MHDFIGKWRIKWMSNWSQEYVDLLEPGYIEFSRDALGNFVFGAVKGHLDVRISSKEPSLEFSWQGICEGKEMSGRGKVDFLNEQLGEGELFIHNSDETDFIIERLH
ncbi:hypothetical protein [Enterovibrio norvegicus]|uniref:hypothetical protein n=1 Tax=Enterovibrio norvegicus TaxID=188144 RepID=UPI000C862EA8|nr:hypothetical protein [Enterovibrio norvegicus]PMI29711.1 hypothetical protein BCU47_19085 [Enterovibrio norvegicus]